MKRFLKKIGYWTLYALYLLAFFAAVDYFFFYRPWVGRLAATWSTALGRSGDPDTTELATAKHVEPALMQRLGKARNDKESSFVRYAKAKDVGVVRICAFGDSYTEGDEVSGSYDYPSFLGRRFAAHGAHNVEVVNFGVGGFGFHQSYMMWESLAGNFGCDVILLGPRGFQPLRDTTFGFIYSWPPYYIHARYVLDGGGVRLVEVPGDSYGERFRHFFSFVPRWRYLRYNRTAPAFMKALVPNDRELPNPFYYDRRPMDEEAAETYRILLGKMAAAGRPIAVGHHRPLIVDLARRLEADVLAALLLHEKVTFPYVEPSSHASPLGNELLASQFFAWLTGGWEEPIPVLEAKDLEWTDAAGARRTMSSYSKVRIELSGRGVGRFVMLADRSTSPTAADALVSLKGPGENVLDSAFFPLELELQPGMEVVLRIAAAAGTEDHRLGEIQVIGGGFNVGRAEVEGFDFLSYKAMQQMEDRGERTPLTEGEKKHRGLFFRGNSELTAARFAKADAITVLVAGTSALAGRAGEMGETPGVWFLPIGRSFRYVRATADGLPALEALGESGVFELVAEHWEEGEVRVPISAWEKTSLEAGAAGRPAPILSIAPDGTVALRTDS